MTAHDEGGMSLVELLVGILVASLVSAMIVIAFVNGLTATQQATARDRATGAANVLSSSLTQSIRNATTFRLTSGGTRLDATVYTTAGTWQCRAWALSAGDLLYSAGTTARATTTAGWTAIATGASGTLIAGAAFAQEGDRGVTIGLRFTRSGETATISSGATAQATATGGAPACW